MASLPLTADDPCTEKSRAGALGQTADQLVEVLSLTPDQMRAVLELQRDYYEEAGSLSPALEASRQAFLDEALTIGEKDGVITETDRERLVALKTEQLKVRGRLLALWQEAEKNIWQQLTSQQKEALTGFVPDLALSEETIEAARSLLLSFKTVIGLYREGEVIDRRHIETLRAALEDAYFVVYLPDWFLARLEPIMMDIDSYGKGIDRARKTLRLVESRELKEIDLYLQKGLSLLAQAIRQDPNADFDTDFPKLKETDPNAFYRSVLVTPVFGCILAQAAP
ncbi:MAG: hypothetical protein QNK37_36525 [Acidobacteriota bacterium]|nr:hypothetical protein [Acidobacteriota bacterium]